MVPVLLISLALLCFGPSSCSVSAAVYRDAQSLVDFRNSLPDPTLLPNWVAGQNPCFFLGVTCGESNRVSEVNLTGVSLSTEFRLVGTLLMTLDRLEKLSLKSANLTGAASFPSGSKCSSSLSSVDLAGNGLSGELSDLSSLAACSSLKSLNLSGNFLESPAKESGGLKLSLEVLDLSHNKISGAGIVPWVLSGGCADLEQLSLKGNKVVGDFTVASCKKLKYLDLSANNFSSSVAEASFGGCAALEHLDISGNKFAGDLGVALSSCKQLTFLNLSSNHFSGPVPAIPTANLQFLSLAHNEFAGDFPTHLTADCANLTKLDISYNNLTGTVPTGLSSCSLLESLDLSSNKLDGNLPIEALLQITNLKKLGLGYNAFSGKLPESLSEMTNLETLDLSSNSFTGPVPAGLCQDPNSKLKELYLQNNMLDGTIPATLSNCAQLVSLDLSFNYLKGTIPPSLGSLSNLRDLILLLNQLTGEIPDELRNIRTLENLILDFNFLTGTIPSGLRNCSNLNWISLSNNQLTGEIPSWIGELSNLVILKLSNNSFYGPIPKELGDCRSLVWVDLNTNQLNGSIPPELFKQSGSIDVNFVSEKMYVYIKNDGSKECHGAGSLLEFVGIRQEQLNRVSTRNPCNFTRVYKGVVGPTFTQNGSMIFFDVSHNTLSGSIPKEIGIMYYCFILNLGHNNISGTIPEELGSMKSLAILDLSTNKLEGSIPQTFSSLSSIGEADLSNNLLSGMIPQSGQLELLQASAFANNTGLCGLPLAACVPAGSDNNQHQKSHQKQASLAGSVAMGLLFSLFCIVGLIIVAIETKKRRKKKQSSLDVYIDSNSHSGTANNTSWKLTGAREALSINLATFEMPLRKLTFADLLEATNGFHNDSLIGSGGFGDVYKAKMKDGSIVAIKKLIHVSGQGDREFTAEMETIGKIKHRNLVPLLGYCKVGDERLLVYEYMKYGSLEDVLHDQRKAGIKLNWTARSKIAIGAARGLAFLHHNCIPHIIHRDMKSSNVLLDENLEARVSDFGMARLMSAMDTHLSVSTLAGTPGYVPPEYYQSFRCTTKGDVYSYGVVLLELLTGRRPTDSADFGDNNLVGWVKQHAKLKISDVFDPELMKEDPTLEIELLQHLKVASACLDDRYWLRPTMLQVMKMFKEIQAGSGMDSASTIATDEGGFGGVELADMSMTIKEGTELKE